MTKAKDCKCSRCGKQAVAFYPCVDPDIPAYPYCADCLEKAMIEVAEAVLEGRKTMTRRVIPIEETKGGLVPMSFWNGKWCGAHGTPLRHQPYKVGEEVAIAQCYRELYERKEIFFQSKASLELYKSTAGWNNKMFVKANLMPRRIRITDIKVERLQDISDVDAIREGIYDANGFKDVGAYTYHGSKETYNSPRGAFASLIDKVSGKGTWNSNPYVFVYEFDLVK